MHRPSTSPKKTSSTRTTSPSPRPAPHRSPAPKTAFGQAFVEQKLRHNRQRLTHTLDTYTMLIHSNNPIRCLEHNSVVSAYCQSDRRLLCSNCIFGKSEHKFHKVIPIDKSEDKIAQQIQKMASIVQKQVTVIGDISQKILNNLASEEAEMHKTLNALTLRYREAHSLLEQSFIKSKQILITNMKDLTVKHQTVALELKFLRDVYSSCTPNQWIDGGDNPQQLLYRHSVLRSITAQNKFDGNVQPQIQPVFHHLGQQQMQKIVGVCSELARNLEEGTKRQKM